MKSKSDTAVKTKKKILIVDDDVDVLKLLTDMLERADYEVMEASYSLPALFEVVRDLPDLILVDINMPIMNGLELIEQFRTYQETRNVPVIVITGMDTPKARATARKLGCVGFLSKPFDSAELLAQVAKVVHA